ncbi:MAG TPA: FtsH protease activity modulator HflK [Candidatus Nitrosocosmicus sp.]|nr:FtsH protease activity modulator HflK [Candidatus Nitrosocosmicus sp.]
MSGKLGTILGGLTNSLKSGNAGQGAGKMIKRIAIIAVFGWVALNILFGTVYKLDIGWNGVVTRFGEVVKIETKDGLHAKMPFIDRLEKVNVQQIRKLEYGYRTVKEGNERNDPEYQDVMDEAMVIVDAKGNNSSVVLTNIVVRYKIVDPYKYLYKVDDIEGTMMLALEDCVRNAAQIFTLNEALTNKSVIDEEIFPEFQKLMNQYDAGVQVVEVKTQNTELLPEVDQAYQQVEEANQFKNSKIQEAMKTKNMLIPQAEAEAKKLTEEAKGEAAITVANAKASVAQYNALYEEYVKNPDVVREKYYVEAMKEFIKNNKVVVDLTGKGDIYKFYNMDQNAIKQQVAQ